MKFFKKSNILFVPFVVLTGSIVILCLLSQVLINFSLEDIKGDTQTIKVASGQRAITQQIVNQVAADNLGGILVGPSIDSLRGNLANIHMAILKGDPSKNLKPLEDVFLGEYQVMDSAFKKFYTAIAVVGASDSTKDFIAFLNMEEGYLKTIDALILRIESYSKTEINDFQAKEILIMLCSLLITFLEVIFIFLPALKKLKKQSQQFREIAFHQSHIVRQPLSNIKALLALIDTTTLDDNNKEMVALANSEADKLDTVVKTIIYNTVEGK